MAKKELTEDNDYITKLKDTDNLKLRKNFEKRFDKDTSPYLGLG